MVLAYRLVLFCLILTVSPVRGNDLPKVLILNSYHPQYLWTQQLTKAVEDTLDGTIPSENLHIKYLNARRFIDDVEHEERQLHLMAYEFTQFKPDLIITFDDAAYRMLLRDKNNLFRDIPVVFGGVNIYDPLEKLQRKKITGIVEGDSIEQNIELITRSQPNIEQIVFLGDRTGLGFNLIRKARDIVKRLKQQPRYADINFDFRDAYHFPSLKTEFAQPTKKTAVLILAIHRSLDNDYFSYEVELPKMSRELNVPIYGMWGALMLGKGAVGGFMNDPYLHGHNVAMYALDVLGGINPDAIPVKLTGTFLPKFDHKQMKRFGIKQADLPTDVDFINKPVGFIQKHKVVLQAFGILSFFLFFVIGTLLFNLRQRSLVQKELRRFNKELENQVQARTSELHQRNKQLEKAAIKMQQFAYEDALTHLGNRRAASEELEGLIKRQQHVAKPLSIALIDIDFFKQVNDSYGHEAGDKVLVQTAIIMKSTVRPLDGTFRWGGEEFLVTLPEASIQNAVQVCERMRQAISTHPFDIPEQITASIGVTELTTDDNIDSLINRADRLLYKAKEEGRNQIAFDE